MLLTKTLEVRAFKECSYYENLGYIIPKHKVGSHKKLMVSRSTFIIVDVNHIPKSSNYKIQYSCDRCKEIKFSEYCLYKKKNFSKGDFCRLCSLKEYNTGILNKNFGKKLSCGFKEGKENYSSINFKGKNNPRYNKNLTDEERLNKRDTTENINWRKSIFKKDNFKCKICNTKGSGIEAHHLNSYTSCKEERFLLDNGITLCKEDHKLFHKLFGYGNNTKEQFTMFIKLIK